MSHTSSPTAQDTHHLRNGHAENAQPGEESPRAEEEEKVDQEAVLEKHLFQPRKDGKNGKAGQTNWEEGHKQEVDFDNFDQFEEAPHEPEEQPSSKLQAEHQVQSTQTREERQHPLSKVSQQQYGEGKEEEKNTNKKSIASTQQKIEEPNHRVSSKAHKQISSQNVEVEGEATSSIRKSITQAPTSFLSGKTSQLIRQAEKERIGFTFGIFLKYNKEYQKIVSSHKFIIRNVCSELASKHAIKKDLQASLLYYFQTYIKIHQDFYERSSKVHKEQAVDSTTNKMANIREELKDGFDLLFSVRKTLTDEMQKMEDYIVNYTFKSLDEAFVTYHKQQKEEEKRQSETIDQYEDAEKQFMDLFEEMEKQFKRGMSGERTKEDLFVCIVKFVNEETDYRQKLIKYGKTVLEFKKTFVMSEKQLFAAIQKTINEFKLESRKIIAVKKEEFRFTENYLREIEAQSGFAQLCTITDMDYIRSVLELQNRKECGGLTDEHFQEYLEMSFFDRFVGDKQDLFKGVINRCFPLHQLNEELVHTISGNLVHYNRETHECKDKFNTKKLNAKVFAEGAVELDEVVKGFVFSSNRTVRLQLQSQDSAEELICYLNEKDQWKEGEGRK